MFNTSPRASAWGRHSQRDLRSRTVVPTTGKGRRKASFRWAGRHAPAKVGPLVMAGWGAGNTCYALCPSPFLETGSVAFIHFPRDFVTHSPSPQKKIKRKKLETAPTEFCVKFLLWATSPTSQGFHTHWGRQDPGEGGRLCVTSKHENLSFSPQHLRTKLGMLAHICNLCRGVEKSSAWHLLASQPSVLASTDSSGRRNLNWETDPTRPAGGQACGTFS